MKHKPVGILITYNQVGSIFKQLVLIVRLIPFEIIVFDDCSTDYTVKVLEGTEANYELKVARQKTK
jgi:glycosyltransferase involved in cell wall biosynthesis